MPDPCFSMVGWSTDGQARISKTASAKPQLSEEIKLTAFFRSCEVPFLHVDDALLARLAKAWLLMSRWGRCLSEWLMVCICPVFPECVARVPVSLGGLGVGLCSPKVAFATATVRNRLREGRKALHRGECLRSGPESVSNRVKLTPCRRSYIGVCRACVCVTYLCRRSYIGVCRGGVSTAVFIGVCRAGVSESDLCGRSYFGVCRGGVCVSDLCRRSYIGVCRGGVCVSVCVSAVILAFAEGLSVWVICVSAVILAFAADLSVWVICGAGRQGPTRVSSKSVPQECLTSVFYKSVK